MCLFLEVGAVFQPNVGDICLPGSPRYELHGHYMECSTNKNSGAGEWIRNECPVGTRFDPSVQKCVDKASISGANGFQGGSTICSSKDFILMNLLLLLKIFLTLPLKQCYIKTM